MLLRVLVSEASLEAHRAELSPMRWPALPNHSSIELLHVLLRWEKHLPTISLVFCLGFCILLGFLSIDLFLGVAWLTKSYSMVVRPSEDQQFELNRKWKSGFMSVYKTYPATGRV